MRKPVEYWGLDNSLIGAIAGKELTSIDGNDYFIEGGVTGQCWNTNGSLDRRLYRVDPDFITTDKVAISVWFKSSAFLLGSLKHISSYGEGSGNIMWSELSIHFLNTITFTALAYGGAVIQNTIDYDEDWHNFIYALDIQQTKLYSWLDGVPTTPVTGSPITIDAFDTLYVSGGVRTFAPPTGYTDSVTFMHFIPTDEEALEMYNTPEYVPIEEHDFWTELSGARGVSSVGNNNTAWFMELRGASVIEPTAFEPDPATYRKDYYYNAKMNVLYKKIITRKEPGIVHAYWQKVSN